MRGKDRVKRNNKECSTTVEIMLLPLILGGKRRKRWYWSPSWDHEGADAQEDLWGFRGTKAANMKTSVALPHLPISRH